MSAEGLILAGDIRMKTLNADGTFGKLLSIGNATKFAIKPNSKKVEQKSKQRGSYGTALTTVYLQDPSEVTLTLERINQQNLLYQFLGEATTYAQTAGTLSNVAVTADLDGWVPIGHEAISRTGLTVTDVAGTTTYVLGTDVEIAYDIGMLRAIPGGAVAQGDVLHVNGSYGAIVDGTAILGSMKNSIRVYIHLDGENLADGSLLTGEFWEVFLTPDQEMDFLSDNLTQVVLKGTMVKPPSKPSPFVLRQRSPV